jgi:acyl carrier protein
METATMTDSDVFEKLLPLVQEVTGARADQVHMESVLVEDLGAESLDLLDLSFLIEEQFGVTIAGDEFEREAKTHRPGLVYERAGLLTEEGIACLREALPEVPPERLTPGMPKVALPRALNVAVFVHLIQRKLAEKEAVA